MDSKKRDVTRFPLWARIAVAVALGACVGVASGTKPIAAGIGTDELGRLGMLVIRVIKALAVPLVLFTILDAVLQFGIAGRRMWKLGAICLANVAVAIAVGVTLMNVLQPGRQLREYLASGPPSAATTESVAPPLDPLRGLEQIVPASVVQPFAENSVIGAVLIAVLAGLALRRVKECQRDAGDTGFEAVEKVVGAISGGLQHALGWIVLAVPFAAFGLVAQAVGRSGLGVFLGLWAFVAVILAGMAIHSLCYYPLVAWLAGGKSPRIYLGGGRDAIFMGIATNSSLATVPVTLRCLTEKMGVSEESARLAVCVGTNLNNDGITLYEAMAALFIAQAFGIHLGIEQQIIVVLAALMAGIGVAGVPEAGLIVLPMVLAAAGLPNAVVAAAIPLVVPVDWILARCRTVVNVLSDMLVAIVLDRTPEAPAAEG